MRTFRKQMQTTVDTTILEFLEKVHQHYPTIHPQTEMKTWKTLCKQRNKKQSKRFTGYNLFVREKRRDIANTCGMSSFGDISKCVGRAWKQLPVLTKKSYQHRAALHCTYFQDETWCHYIHQPFERVFHIAKNWLEDIPSVELSESMSKEEVLALLIRHRELPESTPKTHVSPSESDTSLSPTTENDKTTFYHQYQHLSYPQILAEIRKIFPGFSDVSDTSREDLISLLIQHRHGVHLETKVPIEVHPYYHELRKRSSDAIQQLYRHNFKDTKEKSRRDMIEALIRNFDTIELEIG